MRVVEPVLAQMKERHSRWDYLLRAEIWLLVAGALLAGGTFKPDHQPSEMHMADRFVPESNVDAHRVARIALFALRAVVPQREGELSGRVLMRPEPDLLSERDAAEYLARMSKPVECEASVQEDVLVVECQSLSPRGQHLHESALRILERDRSQPDWWGWSDGRSPGGEGPILLVGRGFEEMRVHAAEMLSFQREYVLLHSYSKVRNDPSAEEAERGVTAQFYFAPSEGRHFIIPANGILDL